MQFEIWEKENGKSPVKSFLNDLDDRISMKIIERLEIFEKCTREQLFKVKKIKPLTKNIYEVRIKINGCHYRFLEAV